MEEAPQGTFEDELEWCIRQLETGLLRQNPTTKQVSDTQRVLQVLRSRKAPFVRKRQMMNQVFGNYRLKMSEERKAQEKAAANPPEPHIQEGTAPDSQSVVYRKCSKDTPGTTSTWFTTSDNTFSFSFCPDELAQGTEDTSGDEGEMDKRIKDGDLSEVNQDSVLDAGGSSGFSFNFQITDNAAGPPQSPELQGRVAVVETPELPNIGVASSEKTNIVIESEFSRNQENLEVVVNSTGSVVTAKPEVGKISEDTPKKKNKKKGSWGKGPTGVVKQDRKAEVPKGETGNLASPQDGPQAGAEELRRELDWCVEQLEIGLQRQKSTPKQMDEALRAIKTLRSEKAALVKKRQVMRVMFGDYRNKMEEEKKKQLRLMQIAAQSAQVNKVTEAARRKSSKVYRQMNHKSCKSQSPLATAQDSHPEPADPGSSDPQMFVFKSSHEPFCFNFQL
ncbi:UPF0488 protein C8orf33 homolog [Pelodytes ibericus]